MKVYLVDERWGYRYKFAKACERGDIGFIKKMIKRGRLIVIDSEKIDPSGL